MGTRLGPRISPNGKHIVFTRRWTDKVHDRMESERRIMGRDGSGQRFLAEGGSARWSPDGTRIAFLREGEPKGTQIHVEERGTTPFFHRRRTPVFGRARSAGGRWR